MNHPNAAQPEVKPDARLIHLHADRGNPHERLGGALCHLEGARWGLLLAGEQALAHQLAQIFGAGTIRVDGRLSPSQIAFAEAGLALAPLHNDDYGDYGDWSRARAVWLFEPDQRSIERARKHGIPVIVDSTLAPGSRWLEKGADYVVYRDAVTLSGHADVSMAALFGVADLERMSKVAVTPPSDLSVSLIIRDIATLPLRLARVCRVVQHLLDHFGKEVRPAGPTALLFPSDTMPDTSQPLGGIRTAARHVRDGLLLTPGVQEVSSILAFFTGLTAENSAGQTEKKSAADHQAQSVREATKRPSESSTTKQAPSPSVAVRRGTSARYPERGRKKRGTYSSVSQPRQSEPNRPSTPERVGGKIRKEQDRGVGLGRIDAPSRQPSRQYANSDAGNTRTERAERADAVPPAPSVPSVTSPRSDVQSFEAAPVSPKPKAEPQKEWKPEIVLGQPRPAQSFQGPPTASSGPDASEEALSPKQIAAQVEAEQAETEPVEESTVAEFTESAAESVTAESNTTDETSEPTHEPNIADAENTDTPEGEEDEPELASESEDESSEPEPDKAEVQKEEPEQPPAPDLPSVPDRSQGKPDLTAEMNSEQVALYEQLREWRNQEAKRKKYSVFVVASNKTLVEIVYRLPFTLEELSEVFGIGKGRLEQYGEKILAIVHEHSSGAR